jgi:xylosylprotein 4-beta-galactosyltransferase
MADLQIVRPEGLKTGTNDTFRHVHVDKERPRDYAKCFDQWKKTRRRDRLTGLNNVNYTIQSVNHMSIEQAPVVMLNVKLYCNLEISPWCHCEKKNSTKLQKKKVKVIELPKT